MLVSCSRGFGREDAITAFSEGNPEASASQSECVVDRLIDVYEVDPVDDSRLDALESELEAKPSSAGFEVEQFRAMFWCGLTEDLESQLAASLVANGIAPERVECVAGELSGSLDDADLDVLLDGKMSDQFFGKFFDAAERCDAIPAEGS